MANNCSTDHNCLFNNNIVLMFQDINVAKSTPFVLLTISQKSMYSPKVFKMPPFWQITRNSPTISLFQPRGMETSNFTANCAKFAQFANHNGEPREIRVIITNFYHSLLLKCTPTFYSKSRKILPIRYYLVRIRRN